MERQNIFCKKEDPLRPFQYSMLQHRVMQMIRKMIFGMRMESC